MPSFLPVPHFLLCQRGSYRNGVTVVERFRRAHSWWIFPLLTLGLLLSVGCKKRPHEEEDPIVRGARQLYLDQQQNDQHIWRSEIEALGYQASLDRLVDSVRMSSQRLSELKRLSFGELQFRELGPANNLAWGVKQAYHQGTPVSWESSDWQAWIDELAESKTAIHYFRLQLVEFKPGSTETNGLDSANVSIECHATSAKTVNTDTIVTRHMLKGELAVDWDRPSGAAQSVGPIARIVVENLRWRTLAEGEAFEQKQRYAVGDPNKRQAVRISPVIVRDFNGDLLPDIILGGVNLRLTNQGDFNFTNAPLLPKDLGLRKTAVAADFTGEGNTDLLGFLADGTSVLLLGTKGGNFNAEPLQPWPEVAEYPSALAVGDVDNDGDLDVWMAQNRPTYHRGVLPRSLDDANDGFPSRLYRNDGEGHFTDITGPANLGVNRGRRTRSAALVDIDNDSDKDLLVTSDYAGVELYTNDGTGIFTEATDATFNDWHLLGQAAAIGRFDDDDRLDFFIGGRWSTAMQRMEALQLERVDFPDFLPLAAKLTSGNQLLLSQPGRGYDVGPFNADAKNTGWTKSATAADFDNDDDDDLYLSTGHVTGRSVSDFDSQFWRHDIFLAEGIRPEILTTYLNAPTLSPRLTALKTGDISWYGYEPNRLQVNTPPGAKDLGGFVDLGFLHGVGLSQDSPAALAADLNLDGMLDLLCIAQRTFPLNKRLAVEQSLVIYGNALQTDGHWLGVHLSPNAPDFIPGGATIRLVGEFGLRERFIHTGLTPTMQGPTTAHFGLGTHEKIDHMVVQWGNGHEQIIVEPALDRYHTIRPRLDFTPIPDPPEPLPEEPEDSEEES